jgi:cytochrome P450
MFWLQEIKDAKKGVSLMTKAGQSILDRYRASKTKEEIEVDTSIIGNLIRGPYPSDRERIADVTMFMLAGYDTTGYQVSWIIIELARHPDVVQKLRVELDLEFTETGNNQGN